MFNQITFNLTNSPIRHEKLHGRAFVVAPMAMITAGVHNGSNGALLYEEGDIKRAVPAWNNKPIVVYHPTLNNRGISAADPDVLEKQQVGMVLNTTYSGGKLRAEAWIEVDRANTVDGRVMDALENNRVMEVSTGLFTDNEPGEGVWNNAGTEEEYVAVARNHQPDHLALLPDQVGACSVADGAGLLVANAGERFEGAEVMQVARGIVANKMSHGNIHQAVNKALQAKLPRVKKGIGEDAYSAGPWLVDIYDKFFVYESEGKLYRLNYTMDKLGAVEITGDADEVVRVTEYRTAESGKFVGNHTNQNQNTTNMKTKEVIVAALIANTANQWGEEDRETLMALDKPILNKMAAPDKPATEEPAAGKKPTANQDKTPVQAAAEEGAKDLQPTINTAEDYIAGAPPKIQQVLRNGMAAHASEQCALIEKITANADNPFSKEFLATKPLDELRGIATLATTKQEPTANQGVPMFIGQSAPAQPTANQGAQAETALETPTMNDKKAG